MKNAGEELSWTAVGVGIAVALGGVFIAWGVTSGKFSTWLDTILVFN